MAAPITHIILALQILNLLPSHFDAKEFIVGTSFPDIRYIAKIEREKTHFEPVSWNDVLQAKSAFHAGMLFHNLVDIIRMRYFEPHFYNMFALELYNPSYIKFFPLALKVAEDAVLFDLTSDWQEIGNYFNTIYEEELEICPNKEIVIKWHKLLQNYIKERPTSECVLLEQAAKYAIDPERCEVKEYFGLLMQNEAFQEKVKLFYTDFIRYLPVESISTPGISN